MNYPQLWRTSGITISLLLGQLVIPSAQAAGHTVRGGDTFTSIAKKYKVSVSTLQKANPQIKPGVILKGQSINIPGTAAKNVTATPKPTKPAPAKQKLIATIKPVKVNAPREEPSRIAATKPVKRGPVRAITTYRVRSGETATTLARRSGISVGELADMNGLDRLELHEGQKLVLPAGTVAPVIVDQENTVDLTPPARRPKSETSPPRRPAPTANPPTSPNTYYHVVTRGETFSSIARSQGVSVAALSKANRAVNPARLAIGQSLNIPGVQVASRQSDTPLIDEAPMTRKTGYKLEPLGENSDSPDDSGTVPSIAYRLTARDNEDTLAREFNTTPSDLRHLNQMGPFDRFTPGSFIQVPWQNNARQD